MAWTAETIRLLAECFDERCRRDVSRFDRLIAPAEARDSVLRDPATEADIGRAEERLGVRLPPSYRAFLLVSDGAYASALGAELREDWRHGLLSIDEVQRTVDADPVGVKVWCEIGGLDDVDKDYLPTAGDPQLVEYYTPYRDGLIITHIANGNDRLALVPRLDIEEWELWDCHHEGATAHPSFADFIRWYAARPDRRTKPEDADGLVEQFESGALFTLFDLAEIGDPRAVELAREAIADGTADSRIPELLGKLGDPANVASLRELYVQSQGVLRWETLVALEQLGAEGVHELLLAAARDDNDPSVRDWAQQKLKAT